MRQVVSQEQIAPVIATHDFARVRVQQQLGRIESLPIVWCPEAVHAIAVDQPRLPARQQPVPDPIGARGQPKALLFVLPGPIEKAELDSLGVRRNQREVDPAR
jgi:hypothetical protein